jgi:hypothetical protein
LQTLIDEDQRFILVANPVVGDLKAAKKRHFLLDELGEKYLSEYPNWSVGCIANEKTTRDEIRSIEQLHEDVTIIHSGYRSGAELAGFLEDSTRVTGHVFIEEQTSKLYRRHFTDGERILIRDGFKTQRRNIDYPDVEHFSDLHITHVEERVDSYGDFLIVGRTFTESGGPAYAVTVHLTFIDASEDDDMFVAHYKSDRFESQVDPGGKLGEALVKLVQHANQQDSPILQTEAIQEFIQLQQSGHYPGLGYVKKLSMQHHMELMAEYLGRGA